MKKSLYISALTVLLFSFVLKNDSLSDKNYVVHHTKLNKVVGFQDIVSEMKNYDVVFLGEEHNDSVAHYLELELFKRMHEAFGNKTVLAMEMFETDCQIVLDEYLNGFIRERNFYKEARCWSNYRDYKPMIEFAKANKLKVVAGNAPARYANMAARMGRNSLMDLSPAAKAFLPPLPYDTASGAYYQKFVDLMSDGRNVGIKNPTDSTKKANAAPPRTGPMYVLHSQSLWDATMAYSISKVYNDNKDAKVIQVNGRFHSDEGGGIVAQLKKYNPSLRILIVTCVNGGKGFPEKIDFKENSKLADYVIYTDPSVPKTYKESF